MPEVTIRRVTGDALRDDYAALVRYGFSPSPPLKTDDYYDRFKHVFAEQPTFVLYEDETAVACNTSLLLQHHVRGKIFPATGIGGVVTLPQARRKGYARRLMIEQLARSHEEGQPLSVLYPFRESFYEQLGYVTFSPVRRYTFTPQALTPLLDSPAGERVERWHADEGFSLYRQMQKHQLANAHGFGMASDTYDKSDRAYSSDDYWLAVARDAAGDVIGVMNYKISKFGGTMTVRNFFPASPEGRYALLGWMARHVDQVGEVDLELPDYERPETWLADMDLTPHGDVFTPMGRVVTIPALGGLRVGRGRVCVRVLDAYCPWNNGVYTFVSDDDGILQIREGGNVNATVTIQALSALVYGTHSPHDFQIRGWSDASLDVADRMERLFPLKQPYLNAAF